jgi:hypothetical protein
VRAARQFGLEGEFARLVDLVDATGFAEPLEQFGGRIGGSLGLLIEGDLRIGRGSAIILATRIGRELQHCLGRTHWRRLEAVAGDLGPRRQGRERQQAADNLALDLDLEAARQLGDAEARIGRQAGRDHLRLGHAELVEGGLQAAIVEQRDLDGAIRRQRLAQKLIDARLGRECGLAVADLGHILADIGIGEAAWIVPMPPSTEKLGAAAQQSGGSSEQGRAKQVTGIRCC